MTTALRGHSFKEWIMPHYSEGKQIGPHIWFILQLGLHNYFTPPRLQQVTSLGVFLRLAYQIELLSTSQRPYGESESGQRKIRVSNRNSKSNFRNLKMTYLELWQSVLYFLEVSKEICFCPSLKVTRSKLDYQRKMNALLTGIWPHHKSILSGFVVPRKLFCDNKVSSADTSPEPDHIVCKKEGQNSWFKNLRSSGGILRA